MDELTWDEINELKEALDDEYHALTTYDQIIADFGNVCPFINIRKSEKRHIRALIALFESCGLPVPENTWGGEMNEIFKFTEGLRSWDSFRSYKCHPV